MAGLVASLKQSGIKPEDIDAVIPTTPISTTSAGSWRPTAAATSRMPDLHFPVGSEFWTDDKRLGTPRGCPRSRPRRTSSRPGRIVFYKDGQESSPASRPCTPRGTRRHHSFVVTSGDKSLFVVGDLMHHVILVEKPRMEVASTPSQAGRGDAHKAMDMLGAQRMTALVYQYAVAGIRALRTAGRRLPLRAEPCRWC